jgi:hypothetical protein
MNTLLYLNASGQYAAGGGGRGFLCKVARRHAITGVVVMSSVRCKGLTKFINRWCPRPKGSGSRGRGAVERTVRLFTLPSGVRAIPSGLASGDRIHRHVMHQLMCAQSGVCRCVRVYGSATPAISAQSASVRACVEAAKSFAAARNLVPVAGEVIIYNTSGAEIATQVDAIFRRASVPLAEKSPVVLVSWKSGAGPRDRVELERHEAQVAFECGTLEQCHGVVVEGVYVVYLSAGQSVSTKRVSGYSHCHKVEGAAIRRLYNKIEDKLAGVATRKAAKLKRKAKK